MLNEKIRSYAFWTLDFLKGSKIRKHYNEIAYLNSNRNIVDIQKRRLKIINNILSHATQTTPFYEKYKDLDELEKFPVIKKTIIQENFSQFKSKSYLNKPYKIVATSGSTGVPFVLHQDTNKKLRNNADVLYFLKRANFNLGEKLYDLQVWENSDQMTEPFEAWKRNINQVNISVFNDSDIQALIEKFKKETAPFTLLGIASALDKICNYLDNAKVNNLSHIKIKSVIAISEVLSDYTKKGLKKYFNINTVSRYSNEELGVLAQQLTSDKNNFFYINWASYHIEILEMNTDRPAKVGEMGRIVVTDLFNYCMPIIRYDTGDIASFVDNPTEDNPYPALNKIEGRRMDLIYNTKGDICSSFLIDYKFFPYFDVIKQYQFIQTGKSDYLIKLNTGSDTLEHEEELKNMFLEDLGKDANIKIEYVNEIPVLNSGKRKKIVNLYNLN